jgi:hypothetical protein
MTLYGNPEKIKKICEWTGKEFMVDWKHRNQRFINIRAMRNWRMAQCREIVKCLTCGKSFERYKNILHLDTGLPTQYCSNDCNRKSIHKKECLKKWIKNHNPMDNLLSREKIKQSKLERYGNSTYNNIKKCRKTMMDKYGVHCVFYLPSCKSNGRRISKFQKRIYEDLLQQHPDAELEKYLPDVKKAVDIYIPSTKKVIECYGDYWHCNPQKCSPTYYNYLVHLTAQEIWEKDRQKVELLKSGGYDVEIIWENSKKRFIEY